MNRSRRFQSSSLPLLVFVLLHFFTPSSFDPAICKTMTRNDLKVCEIELLLAIYVGYVLWRFEVYPFHAVFAKQSCPR